MTFDFKTQLNTGKKGELEFLKRYKTKIDHICHTGDIYGVDFQVKKSGLLLELKTDSYDMDSTPNLFIERFSDFNKQTPGGPWQAQDKGAALFVYNFIKNGTYFTYYLDELIPLLEVLIDEKNLGHVFIQNRGWTTSGYKIKREWLNEICLDLKEVL